MRNFLSLSLFLFMSCMVMKPNQKVKQGIYGTVLLKQGNRMPSPDRVSSPGQPFACEIAIYHLTNVTEAKTTGTIFTDIKTALVAKTSSNAKGYFKVALPPGEYTVFVVEKEGLYANEFNGKGSINPVTVLKDSLTRKDIYISNKAAF